jgi:hypothetical protein
MSNLSLSQVSVPFKTPVEERERCYSFILSRTPHETAYFYTCLVFIAYLPVTSIKAQQYTDGGNNARL